MLKEAVPLLLDIDLVVSMRGNGYEGVEVGSGCLGFWVVEEECEEDVDRATSPAPPAAPPLQSLRAGGEEGEEG